MYRETPPDENGWYWCKFTNGDVNMCWFEPEKDPDGVRYLEVCSDISSVWLSRNVTQWIGPIACPFGDFESHAAYFPASYYVMAQAEKRELLMDHVDRRSNSVTDIRLGKQLE